MKRLSMLGCLALTTSAWATAAWSQEGDGVPSEAELGELISGNTDFALALFEAVREEDGDLFFSPYSISVALGMTYAGARENTATQMAETLRFSLPDERLHPSFGALAATLESRAEVEAEAEGDGFQLTIANALWAQAGFALLPDYTSVVEAHYGAPTNQVDYQNDTEGARRTINTWVSDRTAERIPELIPAGIVSSLTRLVLTNAIYFKASWADAFPESQTADGDFTLGDGTTIQISLMRNTMRAAYTEDEGVEVVEVPYLGHAVAMTIFAPPTGQLARFEEGLSRERLDGLLDALEGQTVDLTMPRFESGSQFSMSQVLIALGMTDAFSDSDADFSGMTGGRHLKISEVLHDANITVDETGTEAAAATAVIMAPRGAAPPPPRVVRVDRPFLYLIRDRETGTLLFMGRLADPR